MKVEQTECSETSAYKIKMLGNYPEESIQHSEHSESLKWRIRTLTHYSFRVLNSRCLYMGWSFNSGTDFFFQETIIRSKVTTERDTCQIWASVCVKPEICIFSPHSLCGSLSANIYLQCALHLTMEGTVQQRVCINFCFHLGKTGAETYEMLQAAFGESCLSRSKTFDWYFLFKSGHRSFKDDPHPGRQSTSHTKETVPRVWQNHSCWPTSYYQTGCRGSQNRIQYVP